MCWTYLLLAKRLKKQTKLLIGVMKPLMGRCNPVIVAPKPLTGREKLLMCEMQSSNAARQWCDII
ncbi:hypothetical protein JSY36_04540 [Bacillus sp. H-16]|uniref:hypothetical protein n=1 Tax=Alteribacter salitolerans TaxID=2912333 RepID=UPI0019630605|nr:hypothetical protein [Alteribacter salitolerans]MBM7095019.1 hypothetical protein [Alteribacter salitolerans]